MQIISKLKGKILCKILNLFLVLNLLALFNCENIFKHSSNPLLLLISFDGFRWDYLLKHNLTNFNYLKSLGTHADYLINAFSTVTFPNHWTLVTGLYEESHGILQNQMYDPILNKTFNYFDEKTHTIEWFGQNKLVEPIWVSNQKAGNDRYSAAEWLGSNIVFQDQNITHIAYNKSRPYRDIIDQFIGLFTSEHKPINFGAIYFDEPDATGHAHGPDSEEIDVKLKELDNLLGYLIEKLKSHSLFDEINLILTSDHGMASTSSFENRHIYLSSYVDVNLFHVYGGSTLLNLFIKNESDLNTVYDKLKNVPYLDVYYKNEFPETYHFKNNIRIGDIILVAKLGYLIIPKNNLNYTLNGNHGYYNNETSMYPFFIAHGPSFRKKFKTKNFLNVDLYPLMCSVLKIKPGINNGSILNVQSMLVDLENRHMLFYGFISLTPIFSALITALVLYIVNKNAKLPGQNSPNDGYMIVSTSETNLALIKNDELNDLNEDSSVEIQILN